MQLPSWLIDATGAQPFANNPANNFQPTLGDAMQGIGHSMMSHYRRDPTEAPGGPPTPPALPGDSMGQTMQQPQLPGMLPGMQPPPRIPPMNINPSPVAPQLWTGQGAAQVGRQPLDLGSVLAMLQGMR